LSGRSAGKTEENEHEVPLHDLRLHLRPSPCDRRSDNGVEPGTAWEDLPDDWVCPDCGVEKEEFEPYED